MSCAGEKLQLARVVVGARDRSAVGAVEYCVRFLDVRDCVLCCVAR